MSLYKLSDHIDPEPQVEIQGIRQPGDFLLQAIWYRRWIVLGMMLVAAAMAVAYLLYAPLKYTVTSRLYLEPQPIVNPGAAPNGDAGKTYLYTQGQLLKSTPVLTRALGQPGADKMMMFEGVNDRIEYLKDEIEVLVGKDDQLVSVSLESAHPEEASTFVAAVVDAYLTYQATQNRSKAGEMLESLLRERETQLADWSEKSRQMVELKRQHGTLSFEEENGSIVMKRLISLSDALVAAWQQSLGAKAAYEEAVRALPNASAPTAEEESEAIPLSAQAEAELELALSTWQQRLRELQQQYLPEHPSIRAAQTRVRLLQEAYVSGMKRRWTVAQQAENDLQRAFDQQQQLALELAASAPAYARLEADVRRLDKLTEGLDDRIQALTLADGGTGFTTRVLEPATASAKPTSPRWGRTLALALVAGLMLGAGIASVKEWIDPQLRSPREISRTLGLPVLWSVPTMAPGLTIELRGRKVLLDPGSAIADAYQMVCTALLHGRGDAEAKVILVTSPGPGEGKSTLASNLAIAMALTRERVLLIDADCRRPAQHRIFNVSNDKGLADVVGRTQSLTGAIQHTAVENLDILTSGPLPQDPVKLLNSQTFVRMMQQVIQRYDRIVMDSPPVMVVPDARILAASCGNTVMVTRADRMSRRAVEHACEGLANVGAVVLGVVVNMSKPSGQFGYGQAYDYRPRRPVAALPETIAGASRWDESARRDKISDEADPGDMTAAPQA